MPSIRSLLDSVTGGSVRRRGLDRWLPGYLATPGRRAAPPAGRPVHLLLCVADHFEPHLGGVSDRTAHDRLDRWTRYYPKLFGGFRDADGRPPRHTFFYPIEEYRADLLNPLADLCRQGFGEIEVHLHHDNDTAAHLRATLLEARAALADRHGQLARDKHTGDVRYGFVHGNWALDNSRPDGRWCGVDNELAVLAETGCYADFTLPSFPSPTQTRTVNRIYYATGRPGCRKSHDTGRPAGTGTPSAESLMLIQGPLVLDWTQRKWGVVPRVENGCLQGNQPPTVARLANWLRARVQVPGRPDWYFVKLHTHGADERNSPVLLGEPTVRFHAGLAERAAADPNFHFHYVTARELYNLARAAEAGWTGSVDAARDYELVWNGATTAPAGRPREAVSA